jgi:hypothetical protein
VSEKRGRGERDFCRNREREIDVERDRQGRKREAERERESVVMSITSAIASP